MPESTKRFAWINIWMMAFAVAGIWLVWPRPENPERFRAMEAIAPLVGVFVIGFFRVPISFYYEAGKDSRPTLDDMARLYLQAWRQLWSQRWLLWVFGAVLALILLAAFANMALQPARPTDRMEIPESEDRTNIVFSSPIVGPAVASTDGHFIPSVGGTGGGSAGVPILALALAGFLIYLSAYAKRLMDDPRYSSQAGLIRLLAAPIVLILVAAAVCTPIAWERFLTLCSASYSGQGQPQSEWMLHVTLGLGAWLVVLLLTAFLVSGVLGSLVRVKRNEAVTLDTFLRDVVRCFSPIAGFYLLLAVLSLALLLITSNPAGMNSGPAAVSLAVARVIRWLVVVLMFVPFAIVSHGLGALQGIGRGVRDWFSHGADSLSFVALGITFISIAEILKEIPSRVLYVYSNDHSYIWVLLGYVNAAILTATPILITAFMIVAVWEFYWRISRSSLRGHSVIP